MLIVDAVDKLLNSHKAKFEKITGDIACEFCEGSHVGYKIYIDDLTFQCCDDHAEELRDIKPSIVETIN